MKIKGVIFDMDGLLIDSENNNRIITQQIYKDYGWVYNDDVYLSTVGTNRANCDKVFLQYFENDQKKLDIYNEEYFKRTYQSYYDGTVPLKKGAFSLVQYLKENQIPFALATSSGISRVNVVFNKTEFGGNPFEKVVTGPEVSRSKPAPDIFLKAAEIMNVDIKDCLVLEDSFNGIRAGKAANAYTIMVPDILPPNQEIKDLADMVVNDLDEVLKMFKDGNL